MGDDAEASSVYTTGTERPEKSPFSPRQALEPGSGYWCSKGDTKPQETVVFEGHLRKRRPCTGLKVSWAYAPGEIRVRTTADGVHWDTPIQWHSPQKGDVSFEEDMIFDRPRHVMDFEIEMRKKREWGYFGIN